MRQILDNSDAKERKKKAMEKLVEKYYGKKAILATWQERPVDADYDYILDLKRRLRTHHNDIAYRGGDVE